METLTIFLSSTVKDFGPVRRDIRAWFETMGAVVRSSESDDFLVDDGVSSHEACLRAIEGSHVVVVLIGDRYGGKYLGTPKSITRREFERAVELGIPTVVLVRDDVNKRAEQWSRRELAAPPFDKDTDAIIAFIDLVRKDRVDNWMHGGWDGSFHNAKSIVRARVNALFTRYQKPHKELLRRAEGLGRYAAARHQLDATLLALRGVGSGAKEQVDTVLQVVADNRVALLGFEPDDRWNLAVYRYDAQRNVLGVFARRAHESIPRYDRDWPPGVGHVGATWVAQKTLIAPDLTVTSSWSGARETDAENYLSAVSEPIVDGADGSFVRGVIVITSNRRDHFRDPNQAEVLTVRSLALLLQGLL